LPVGWDLADALPEGLDAERRRDLLEHAEPASAERFPGAPTPRVDELLTVSGLASLSEGAGVEAVETALRALAGKMNGADPLRRMTFREAAVRRLKTAGLSSPARMVDAAFGAIAGTAEDDAQGSALALSDSVPWPESVDGAELLD